MAAYSGSALYLEWITSGGTTVLNTDFRSLSYNSNVALINSTAGSDSFNEYISGLKDGSLSLQCVFQADGTALWTSVAENTSGTLIVAPEGTASGNEKLTIPAIVETLDRSQPYNDIVTLSVSFKQTAARTDGNY